MFELDGIIDTPCKGQVWYDTETDKFLTYDGNVWVVLHPDDVYEMLLSEAMAIPLI